MHPIILEFPFGISIKAYGLMMMLGFAFSTWWAMHRARQVKADPDVILNLGFIALLVGIAGARLLYVIQFWEDDFAHRPWTAIVNLTSGGLVFYGGFLAAVGAILLYLWLSRHSVRLYMDILAPSIMLGLAFGRMGCFLNGCCWGAPTERVPWAVQFPYASPAFISHWHDSLVDVPEELMVYSPGRSIPQLISREHVGVPVERLIAPKRELEEAKAALDEAKQAGAGAADIEPLERRVKAAQAKLTKVTEDYYDLLYAYDAYRMTPAMITAMARHHRSLAVHPVQIYSIIDALLIAALLHVIFMRRRRQGVVFGLLFIFYPIGRYLEEAIRGDNSLNYGIGALDMTISQSISFWSMVVAVVYLIAIHRLPATPPTAVRTVPAEESQPGAAGVPATK